MRKGILAVAILLVSIAASGQDANVNIDLAPKVKAASKLSDEAKYKFLKHDQDSALLVAKLNAQMEKLCRADKQCAADLDVLIKNNASRQELTDKEIKAGNFPVGTTFQTDPVKLDVNVVLPAVAEKSAPKATK